MQFFLLKLVWKQTVSGIGSAGPETCNIKSKA
jgi:hypothetical protein